jgi:hypothetical protein
MTVNEDEAPLPPFPEQTMLSKLKNLPESTMGSNDTSNESKPTSTSPLSSSIPRSNVSGGPDGSSGDKRVTMMSDLPPRPKQRISTHDLNFGIPSNMAAQEHVTEMHGKDSMKASVLRFLHKKWVQLLLLALLLLDILILFMELLLLGAYPSCQLVVRDCIACCPASPDDVSVGGARWLAAEGEHYDQEICEVGYEDIGQPSCNEHRYHVVHSAELAMFWTTVTILSIFMIEILLEMWAISPSVFFRQCFYTIDFIVIAVSLALEIMFHYISRVLAQELAGFVVFFRLWRFVRVSHGIVEVTSELTHEVYEELLEYAAHCEVVIQENILTLPETTTRVHKMVDDKVKGNHV